ncbi:MAG: hypothetical protein M9899_01405 [Bdellovibrionaceae bacterium]|nr:hypothetical protein [Pseudobdellovibrionaceae bacterium]
MLQSLDFALIGVVSEKRWGTSFGQQFIKTLGFLGIIENISAVYQFKPKGVRLGIPGELGMTHMTFCILIQLKDAEDWGQDFGRQVNTIAKELSEDLGAKGVEVQILDFRSQFTMCKTVILPYPHWLDREEFLYPSLEVLPKDYIHPVLNRPLLDFVTDESQWEDSAFLKTGHSLLAVDVELD